MICFFSAPFATSAVNNISDMTFFIIGTLSLLVFLAWATYRSAQMLRIIKIEQNLLLVPAENVFRVALILVCFGLAWLSGLPPENFGMTFREPARDVILGLIVGVACAFVLPPVTRFAIAKFGRKIYSPVVVLSVLPRERGEWFVLPTALAFAVLLEEFLFRALLLGGFSEFAPPLVLAATLSLLFGAMHSPQGVLGMAMAAVLGFIFSMLFLYTASLLAPLIAHYAINLLEIVWASRDKTWLENYDTDPGSHL